MAVEYEVKITGRVQGVGFRYFVQKKAAEFDITGWVKNMPDGSVMVRGQGEAAQMDAFLGHLQQGPAMAHVEHVTKNKMPGLEPFHDFRVRY